ncbi:sensor histidine kinase [Aggregicoccus sp. 17bor-14]|uniref:sensor histidine kinase n=1 Tax=Myxococcaceae TaxID=31 RepID=UPI00129C9B3D|nr:MULTISPECIES: sensor histidine kinase [Myxococcaceae]MBF5045300.1 sensor histidine kinase [Simulacricoccus sp. 17bor-14]MRI91041.1 sensor histidine kinase [Aggregicoccus sp. 17bor-14]
MPQPAPLEQREQPPRRTARARLPIVLLWGLGAGALGLLLNRVELTLVPAVQLIFGPLPVLAAAVLLGPVGGGLAGGLAGLTTFLMWKHPWAWLGMALEGAAVGALSRRVRPLPAVFLYWLFGAPYILLAYHFGAGVPLVDAGVVALKQGFNSLLAMLIVYVPLLLPVVRRQVRPWLPAPLRQMRLAGTLSAALMLGTVLPLVAVGAAEGRSRYAAERRRLDEQNLASARIVADTVGRSLAAAQRSATILTGVLEDELAREGRLPEPARLQGLLARWVDNTPSLTGAYVGDAQGRVLARYPPISDQGLEGLQYADRDYFRELQRTHRPALTGVFVGRTVPGPVVAAVAPVLQGGRLVGYVALGLDVRTLAQLARARILEGQRARLVDPRGFIVVDSAGAPAAEGGVGPAGALTTVRNLPLGAALARAQPGRPAEYSAEAGAITLRRVRASSAFALEPLPQLGWQVVVEQPLGFLDRAALTAYAALLVILGLALLGMAVGARALSRVLARPLEAVSDAAQRLARGERSARAGGDAAQGSLELARLGAAFDAMADQLGSQLEALERARRERDQFLSVASHELKTPLATLKAQVQLLQRRLPESEAQTVPRLVRQLDRITRLVNLMLDVSELESGRLRLERRPFALDGAVRDAAERRLAGSPLHLLRLRLQPVSLTGDAPRLEQLVHNLVDNAVKFSPEGGAVEVSLEVQDGAGAPEAVLSVADRGVGLEAQGEALLQRFPGGQQRSVARVAGLGVGLFFCREVAERHGGRIQVSPRAGGGTRATVWLPLAPPAPEGAATV